MDRLALLSDVGFLGDAVVRAAQGGELQDMIARSAAEEFKRRETANARSVVRIRVSLTESEQKVLEGAFPHVRFEYHPASTLGHGLADARRSTEEWEALRVYGKSAKVVDVGGNYAHYFMKGFTNVHCCDPVLDWRDAARAVKRDGVVWRRLRSVATQRDLDSGVDFLNEESHWHCRGSGQDCRVKADVCLFVHSCYDIAFDSISDICAVHSAKEAYATMVFDPVVLVKDEGVIEGMNMRFVKEYRYVSTRATDKLAWNDCVSVCGLKMHPSRLVGYRRALCIVFFFVGSSDAAYVHEYSNYIDYVRRTYSRGENGVMAFERDVRQGIMTLRGFSIDGAPAGIARAEYAIWYKVLNTDVFVRVFRLVNPAARSFQAAFAYDDVPLPYNVVNETIGYMLSQDDAGNTGRACFKFMRSFNVRFSMNGVDMLSSKREDHRILHGVSTTLYLDCFSERHAQRIAAGAGVQTIMDDRKVKNLGFFGALYTATAMSVSTLLEESGSTVLTCMSDIVRCVSGLPARSGVGDRLRGYIYDNMPRFHGVTRNYFPDVRPYVMFSDVIDMEFRAYHSPFIASEDYLRDNYERVLREENGDLSASREMLVNLAKYASSEDERVKYMRILEFFDEKVSQMPGGVDGRLSEIVTEDQNAVMESMGGVDGDDDSGHDDAGGGDCGDGCSDAGGVGGPGSDDRAVSASAGDDEGEHAVDTGGAAGDVNTDAGSSVEFDLSFDGARGPSRTDGDNGGDAGYEASVRSVRSYVRERPPPTRITKGGLSAVGQRALVALGRVSAARRLDSVSRAVFGPGVCCAVRPIPARVVGVTSCARSRRVRGMLSADHLLRAMARARGLAVADASIIFCGFLNKCSLLRRVVAMYGRCADSRATLEDYLLYTTWCSQAFGVGVLLCIDRNNISFNGVPEVCTRYEDGTIVVAGYAKLGGTGSYDDRHGEDGTCDVVAYPSSTFVPQALRESVTDTTLLEPDGCDEQLPLTSVAGEGFVVPGVPRNNDCMLRTVAHLTNLSVANVWRVYALSIGQAAALAISARGPLWTFGDVLLLERALGVAIDVRSFALEQATGCLLLRTYRRSTVVGPRVVLYHAPNHWFARGFGDKAYKYPEGLSEVCALDRAVYTKTSSHAVLNAQRKRARRRAGRERVASSGVSGQSAVLPVECSPGRLTSVVSKQQSRDFCDEASACVNNYLDYLRAEDAAMVNMHAAVYDCIRSAGHLTDRVRKLHAIGDQQFVLYDRFGESSYNCKDVSGVGSHVFCPRTGQIVPVRPLDGGKHFECNSTASQVLGSSYLEFYYNRAITNGLSNNRPRFFDARRKYNAYKGCGGCGKSREIIQSTKPTHVVLCKTRRATDVLRDKLRGRIHEKRVRTIDGFVMNCMGIMHGDVLHVDEAMACHAGQILLVAESIGASEIWLYGDYGQMSFVSRVAGVNVSNWKPPFALVKRNMLSHRFPMDVAVGCRDEPEYGEELRTTSSIVRSVSLHPIKSLGDLPEYVHGDTEPVRADGDPKVCWMTWTQAIKADMLRKGYRNVRTIGETQGMQCEIARLVDTSPFRKGIPYSDLRQRNIAMHRHTKVFEYYYVEGNKDNVHMTCQKLLAIRDIVAAHGDAVGQTHRRMEPNGVGGNVDLSFGMAPAVSMDDPLNTLQTTYDMLFPGRSTVPTEYDNYNMEYCDMAVNTVGMMKLKPTKTIEKNPPRRSFRPRLRSAIAPLRNCSLRQAVVALNKRNLQMSTLSLPTTGQLIIRDILNTVYARAFRDDWRRVLDSFGGPMGDWPGAELLKNYVTTMTESNVQKALAAGFDVYDFDISEFEFIVKKQVTKPSTDERAGSVYEAAQNIMFNKKNVNMVYGAVYRELVARLKTLLRPNVMLNIGKSLDDIENVLSRQGVDLNECTTLQNDFSKFDKSQQAFTRALEDQVMVDMCMPVRAMQEWSAGHVVTRNVGYQVGVVVFLLYQRKSGDASTSAGNTLVGFIAVIYCYNLGSFVFALFLGDDSCVFVRRASVDLGAWRDGPRKLAEWFNMEAKLDVLDVPYFCGYFLLPLNGYDLKLVRDPIRAVLKLGRWDLADEEVVKEYWISFRDNLRNYCYEEAHVQLARSCRILYRVADDVPIELITRSLLKLSESYDAFRQMWDATLTVTTY